MVIAMNKYKVYMYVVKQIHISKKWPHLETREGML